ncbi:hypothetical protein APHAL10511_004159 [Amanita phalloides]|nr:hypothetical protein APHAL10511_004159 [Amanita phalloides]
MVQYWQVLNLDRRELLGQEPRGEIADILLSGVPDALVSHLRVEEAQRGRWAGNRIVVVSDRAVEYPEGMLTAQEQEEVEDMYLDEKGEGEYDEDDPAPTLYAFAEEWYTAVTAENGPGRAGKEWHLRNLSKKEYVRSDGVAGLGQAVVVSTCWTNEEEAGVRAGQWAGDRLEIREAGAEPEAGWADISAEVGRAMAVMSAE